MNESRSGAGGYFHTYTYDNDDNRTSWTAHSAPVAQALDFAAADLPAQVAVETGMWQVSSGKLQAQPQVPPAGDIPGEGEAARAKLATPPGTLGNIFTVKVKPGTDLLAVGGSAAFAGFQSGNPNWGRYIAGGPDRGSSLSGSQCDSTTSSAFYWFMKHSLVG